MTLRAADQFHLGIVVNDFESSLDELSAVLGYQWGRCQRISGDDATGLRVETVSRSLQRRSLQPFMKAYFSTDKVATVAPAADSSNGGV